MTQLFNAPGLPPNGDPRTPDILITPNVGVTYSGSTKKLAEHGGFAHDDVNVMTLLSNPGSRRRPSLAPFRPHRSLQQSWRRLASIPVPSKLFRKRALRFYRMCPWSQAAANRKLLIRRNGVTASGEAKKESRSEFLGWPPSQPVLFAVLRL